MKSYNYLIVGAGLYNAVFAERLTKEGKKCLVIDRRPHIAGNVYSREVEGIHVHQYGPHIFHTNNRQVWDYVNQFISFTRFTLETIANYKGEGGIGEIILRKRNESDSSAGGSPSGIDWVYKRLGVEL